MHDLIYCGDEYESYEEIHDLFSGRYPNAILEKDFDGIHGYRIAVEAEEADTKEYFNFLIDEGLASISFKLQMAARAEGEDRECLREIIAERKSEAETDN